jgi:hypothetical protein
MTTSATESLQYIDVAIVGGGIAGTWLLRVLSETGYSALLLEADTLGCDQTLASQGMIHGGLKYALGASLTGASEAIATMPSRWRQCIAGVSGPDFPHDPDLSGVTVLSGHYYMFAERSALGKLTGFFASKALRGRIDKVPTKDWPECFTRFDGVVYRLNDFVVDTRSLLHCLVAGLEDKVLRLRADADNVEAADGGYRIQLEDTTLQATHLISSAGNGSAALADALGVTDLPVQQRPLKQVVVRSGNGLHMFAHCLTGITSNEPRLTITTHDSDNGSVWYLGGRLATTGVDRSDEAQIAFARHELQRCLGWLDWSDAAYDVLLVNRAEPQQRSGSRPDEASVRTTGNFIQCFPTKLTLAPDLGDKVRRALPPPAHATVVKTNHPRATVGASPW